GACRRAASVSFWLVCLAGAGAAGGLFAILPRLSRRRGHRVIFGGKYYGWRRAKRPTGADPWAAELFGVQSRFRHAHRNEKLGALERVRAAGHFDVPLPPLFQFVAHLLKSRIGGAVETAYGHETGVAGVEDVRLEANLWRS